MVEKVAKKGFYELYRKNIFNMAQYLATDQTIKTHCRGLHASFSPICSSLKGNKNTSLNISIPHFEFKASDKDKGFIDTGKSETSISIGGTIKVRNKTILQAISVCIILNPTKNVNYCENGLCHPEMSGDSTYIIRRFHFDIDTENNEKPTSHFQYGGKIHEGQRGNNKYSLFSALDNPRVPIHPTDIIQVLNIFLSQFNSELSQVVMKPTWKSILRENDQIWLEYYHKYIVEFLRKHKPDSFYDISQTLPLIKS